MSSLTQAALPDPWLTGLWIPAISSAAVILLGGASLIIALVALRQSRAAERNTRRGERAQRVGELYQAAIATRTALNFEPEKLRAVEEQLDDLDRKYQATNLQGPASITGQLQYWLAFAAAKNPDTNLRFDIGLDIIDHVEAGIRAYVEDDTEKWTLKRHTIETLDRHNP